MIENFYYVNHNWLSGDTRDVNKIVFGSSSGVFANYNDLRDYGWSYTVSTHSVGSFKHESTEKKLPVVFATGSASETIALRNSVFECLEKDILTEQNGRLYIGDYYLDCYIYGASNSNYLYDSEIDTTFNIICSDPTWHKESTFKFSKGEEATQSGIDFPFDFPFDLGVGNESTRKVISNNGLGTTPFEMTIFGPCENPSVEIAGHTYKVTGSLLNSEYLVIKSDKNNDTRSIKKISGGDGSEADWFSHRDKTESIFEPIPSGDIVVAWDGSFDWTLKLIQSRSEPIWVI